MSEEAIPDEVRRFILTAIPSVPYLEAVLQFQRQPEVPRSAEDIGRALYVSVGTATELLQAMSDAGVVQAQGEQFRYAPDEALGQALTQLAEVYARNLIGVSGLIHDATQRSAQRFAEAFRLRRRT